MYNFLGEIVTSDPSIYMTDHPYLTVSKFMENSIDLKRDNLLVALCPLLSSCVFTQIVGTFILPTISGFEKSTHPLTMTSTSCCKMSRNFDCFQCKLLNLQTHRHVVQVDILRIFHPCIFILEHESANLTSMKLDRSR